MPLILHIETSSSNCSVCLSKGDKVLSAKDDFTGFTHAENMAVFTQEVMNAAGVKLKDIDAVSVSEGPGSYTGLRIGLSFAKGLCYALNKPLIAISTLQQLAAKAIDVVNDNDAIYLPMIDARRMEVYSAAYDFCMKELITPQAVVLDENSFSDLSGSNKIYCFGDGAEKFVNGFRNESFKLIENILPSSLFMVQLAIKKFEQKQFEDVAYFEPFYLKEANITQPKSTK